MCQVHSCSGITIIPTAIVYHFHETTRNIPCSSSLLLLLLAQVNTPPARFPMSAERYICAYDTHSIQYNPFDIGSHHNNSRGPLAAADMYIGMLVRKTMTGKILYVLSLGCKTLRDIFMGRKRLGFGVYSLKRRHIFFL